MADAQGELLDNLAKPGDGIGYPVPYNGSRMTVDHDFLKKCRSLASFSGAYRLNENTVMKTGEAVRMSEATAMRLVAERTSMPVPKVRDAYVQADGRGVIFMDYIEGETLDKPWERYGPEGKQLVVAELQRYLAELRAIEGSSVSAVDGSPCCDQFFPLEGANYGPYQSVDDFHRGLAQALSTKGDNSWHQMVSRFLTSLGGQNIVLTHNDLAPRNILVRDGKIVAVLDWELCGFFPDSWEYIKAYLWADWNSAWVLDKVPDQILTPRLSELAVLLHARDIIW
ncbi:hypothetical protein LTR37_009395 [Vermiconidia calcicola]|uniref:Uncharacterized protein n=1 Tax=Vermiconidia calcicola TaxID=1690605 RepID=A0ACC3N9I8_9PEZI|nr:hypothetical protein LTR37_009395 [Vermiconidia calcicola]